MSSRVLVTNFQLGITKLWSQSVKKKYVLKMTKINFFLKSFFFYFFAQYGLFVFVFYIYKIVGSCWRFDLFMFRMLKNFFNKNETMLQNVLTWKHEQTILHKRRRPFTLRTRVFFIKGGSVFDYSHMKAKHILIYLWNLRKQRSSRVLMKKYFAVKYKNFWKNIVHILSSRKVINAGWYLIKLLKKIRIKKKQRKIKYLYLEKKRKTRYSLLFKKKRFYILRRVRNFLFNTRLNMLSKKWKKKWGYRLRRRFKRYKRKLFLAWYLWQEKRKPALNSVNLILYFLKIKKLKLKYNTISQLWKKLYLTIVYLRNNTFFRWKNCIKKFVVYMLRMYQVLKQFVIRKKKLIRNKRRIYLDRQSKVIFLQNGLKKRFSMDCLSRKLKLKFSRSNRKVVIKNLKKNQKRYLYRKNLEIVSNKLNYYLLKYILQKKVVKFIKSNFVEKVVFLSPSSKTIQLGFKQRGKLKNMNFSKLILYLNIKKYLSRKILTTIQQRQKWLLQKSFKLLMSLELMIIFRTTLQIFYFSNLIRTRAVKLELKKLWDWANRSIIYQKKNFYHIHRLVYLFFLSFKFLKFYSFFRYLAFFFEKHPRKNWQIIQLYKIVLQKSIKVIPKLTGLRFILHGKLNRRPRARVITIAKGAKPPFQALNARIYYSARKIITDFGAYYIKLWLYYR